MPEAIIKLADVTKHYGAVRALAGVDFEIQPGECVGLVGHNGAGKSTLINIINGSRAPSDGQMALDGKPLDSLDSATATRAGIRCVFQELSLCPNLSIAENARILHPSIKGYGWRRRAGDLMRGMLDEIFEHHGIRSSDLVGDLSITRRQMAEIARAFSESEEPVRLVILDEPTSSLDATFARQLLTFIHTFTEQGGAVILISHLLDEILTAADRIVVMRDGRIADARPVAAFDKNGLIAAMGSVAADEPASAATGPGKENPLVVDAETGGKSLEARKGEIIGLAGLEGHGQTAMLQKIFQAGSRPDRRISVNARMAVVAGDRQREGIFPLWSIARNISIRSLEKLLKGRLIDGDRETALAEEWRERIKIRTEHVDTPITSLSGGNQQKVLFARALASDADLILMDDPMRGVDIGTKQEVYEMIRGQARGGRTFLWYTTEFDELKHCDHVYVFSEGRIAADMPRGRLSEQAVLQSSFEASASSVKAGEGA